jgi:peptide chain release factor 2
MGAPGFWDDQERAAQTSSAHARAQRRLATFRELERDAGDLSELAEMADEDPELAAELGSQLDSVESRLAELEEARLFSGAYDGGDAVVTIRSGAGGTDSQDWAEMLLRMYLRWAERRGFEVEMAEASEGEEAGIKSASFIAKGENAYGATPRSLRSTSRRWSTTRSRSSSTRSRSGSTPIAPRAPAAST